jgi:putative flippase GtrA
VFAWLAGAVPNYWLNRSWTWRRTGRPGLRDELLPYAAIIGLTLLIATVATQLVDTWLRSLHTDDTLRVTAVGAAFFGVYVVMFGVRFVLLDGMFGRLRTQGSSPETTLGHP